MKKIFIHPLTMPLDYCIMCAVNHKQSHGCITAIVRQTNKQENEMNNDWFIKIVYRSLKSNKRLVFRRRYSALTFNEVRAIVDGSIEYHVNGYEVVSVQYLSVA